MTDLEAMLQTLTVSVQPDRYTFIDVPSGAAPRVGNGVAAVISEAGSDTVVATIERAEHEGWPIDFVAAWLTLDIHSALHAVGLTAAFSAALADAGIPCNVLAGFRHDHLLVPAEQRTDAVATLEALSSP